MKKIFKLISLISILAIIAAAFAGCGGKEETKATTDGKSFTYWTVMNPTSANVIADYSEMMMYQELEKRTGVRIDFIHPIQGSTGSEAFLTMLSGDTLPDMVEYDWTTYTGGAQQAIDDEVIISLNDYLEEHAPNYNDYMNGEKGKANNNLYKLQSTTHAGQHYGFNVLNIGTSRIFNGICIREDMLKRWGMDMPETIDDWTAVFAKAKSEGFSKPLTGVNYDFSFTGSTAFFNTAFNVGKYYYVEGDKVVFSAFQKGFKEYIAQMAEWTKLGYIDTGFVTNDSAKVKGNLANNISIAAVGGVGGVIGNVVPAARVHNPEFTLVGCPLPVSERGKTAEYRSMTGEAGSLAIAITTACGNYEKAVEWCDYLYSDEGMVLHAFGIEGDTFTIEETGGEKHYIYTDKILKPETSGVNSINEALYKYMLPANHPGLNQHPDYLNGWYELDEQKQAIAMWNDEDGIANAKAHFLPTLDYTEEEASEKTDIIEIAEPELEIAITDIILGRKSISTYDEAIKKAKDSGFDRVLEIMQAAYDRYLSKLS